MNLDDLFDRSGSLTRQECLALIRIARAAISAVRRRNEEREHRELWVRPDDDAEIEAHRAYAVREIEAFDALADALGAVEQ